MGGNMSNTKKWIIEFIKSYIKKHGYPPYVREIAAGVGLKSTSTVHAHLKALIEKGYLETDAEFGSPRALRVPGMDWVEDNPKFENAESDSIKTKGRRKENE
jgi:repressor LexA